MFSVPFDLTAAGTWAASAALALVAGTPAVDGVDVLVEELLLPQPANASTASAGRPMLATSLRM
jgi:hypothetical protein